MMLGRHITHLMNPGNGFTCSFEAAACCAVPLGRYSKSLVGPFRKLADDDEIERQRCRPRGPLLIFLIIDYTEYYSKR